MTKQRVMIGWPSGGSVHSIFAESLVNLIHFEFTNPSDTYELVAPRRAESLYVEENRNDLVHRAREQGADWLFQLDTDESFRPELLRTIMRTADPVTRPFIVGLYANVSTNDLGEFAVVDHIFGEQPAGDYTPVVPPEDLKPFRVDAAGTGVFLTHLSMYDRMEEPWYWLEKIWVKGKPKPQTMNEDIAFCRRAREAGYQIWCDPLAEVIHWKTLPLVSSNMRGFLRRAQEVKSAD